MEISFCELRTKIVVNLSDGRKLGHVIDLIFDQNSAKVLGVVVPSAQNALSTLRPNEDIFIPFHQICRIGTDTILVELSPPHTSGSYVLSAPTQDADFSKHK